MLRNSREKGKDGYNKWQNEKKQQQNYSESKGERLPLGVVRDDAGLVEVLLDGILGVERDALGEVLELGAHGGQGRGAAAVLLPLVLPEAVLAGVRVDVGPVGLRKARN